MNVIFQLNSKTTYFRISVNMDFFLSFDVKTSPWNCPCNLDTNVYAKILLSTVFQNTRFMPIMLIAQYLFASTLVDNITFSN